MWKVNNKTHNNVWKLSFENGYGKERKIKKRGFRMQQGIGLATVDMHPHIVAHKIVFI